MTRRGGRVAAAAAGLGDLLEPAAAAAVGAGEGDTERIEREFCAGETDLDRPAFGVDEAVGTFAGEWPREGTAGEGERRPGWGCEEAAGAGNAG